METKEKLFKIPEISDEVVNLISLISGIVTICTPIIGLFSIQRGVSEGKIEVVSTSFNIIVMILAFSTLFIMWLKIRKYKRLLQAARRECSKNCYEFMRGFRNNYFELLSKYKTDDLNVSQLTSDVKNYLENALDCLCNILQSFSGQQISGCIKLIDSDNNKGGELNPGDAYVKTFARSRNADINRKNYDVVQESAQENALISKNTDFRYILGMDVNKSPQSFFYQSNLIKYDKKLKESGSYYANTTELWSNYYKSTIVVPIRIKRSSIYFDSRNENYSIIGFLCVDSLSTKAFLKNQSDYNYFIVKAFAATAYVVLNKYRHYLEKITQPIEENGENG